MKKSTLETIANYLANVPEMTEVYNELIAEINRNESKKAANRAKYDEAKSTVLAALAEQTHPITISELYDEVKSLLPADFSKGKLQYAVSRGIWEEIEVIGGTNPLTYRIRA